MPRPFRNGSVMTVICSRSIRHNIFLESFWKFFLAMHCQKELYLDPNPIAILGLELSSHLHTGPSPAKRSGYCRKGCHVACPMKFWGHYHCWRGIDSLKYPRGLTVGGCIQPVRMKGGVTTEPARETQAHHGPCKASFLHNCVQAETIIVEPLTSLARHAGMQHSGLKMPITSNHCLKQVDNC